MEMSDDGNTIVTCTHKAVVIFDWDGSEWIPRGTVLSTYGYSGKPDNRYGKNFWLGMSGEVVSLLSACPTMMTQIGVETTGVEFVHFQCKGRGEYTQYIHYWKERDTRSAIFN